MKSTIAESVGRYIVGHVRVITSLSPSKVETNFYFRICFDCFHFLQSNPDYSIPQHELTLPSHFHSSRSKSSPLSSSDNPLNTQNNNNNNNDNYSNNNNNNNSNKISSNYSDYVEESNEGKGKESGGEDEEGGKERNGEMGIYSSLNVMQDRDEMRKRMLSKTSTVADMVL